MVATCRARAVNISATNLERFTVTDDADQAAATCSPALAKRESIHPWSGSSPSLPSRHLASPRWPLREEWDR
jgi:hypothetical protein